MAKICKKCTASVNSKSMECPYCGSMKFENEVIESIENEVQQLPKSVQVDGLYSDKLEQLINLAISDGELTEKEKQVLFKKAEQEGIDLDEFEMVLDSRLKLFQPSKPITNNSHFQTNNTPPPPVNFTNHTIVANANSYDQLERLIDLGLKDGEINELERQTIFEKGISLGISNNEINMILSSKVNEKKKFLSQSAAPKSDKYGDVKKCPACGSIVTSFSAKCGDCGHEFSNIDANASIQKLFSLLLDLENKYSNPNEKVGLTSLFTNALSKASNSDELIIKKCELIKNFPIPNTKDDILEFLSSAVPHARKVKTGIGSMFASKSWGGSDSNAYKEQEIGKAWKYKCEQIVMKARFSLKEDKKSLEEINIYANELGIK